MDETGRTVEDNRNRCFFDVNVDGAHISSDSDANTNPNSDANMNTFVTGFGYYQPSQRQNASYSNGDATFGTDDGFARAFGNSQSTQSTNSFGDLLTPQAMAPSVENKPSSNSVVPKKSPMAKLVKNVNIRRARENLRNVLAGTESTLLCNALNQIQQPGQPPSQGQLPTEQGGASDGALGGTVDGGSSCDSYGGFLRGGLVWGVDVELGRKRPRAGVAKKRVPGENGSGIAGCLQCGIKGHLKRDCTEEEQRLGCFKCGEQEHIAKECPNFPKSHDGGREDGQKCKLLKKKNHRLPLNANGVRGCYNCDSVNHIARDCPRGTWYNHPGNQHQTVSTYSLPSLCITAPYNAPQHRAVTAGYRGGHRGGGVVGPQHQHAPAGQYQHPPARYHPPNWRQQHAPAVAASASSSIDDNQLSAAMSNLNLAPRQSSDSSECSVCMANKCDSVLYVCGHICMCYKCAMEISQKYGFCPVCRQPIKDVIKTFRC